MGGDLGGDLGLGFRVMHFDPENITLNEFGILSSIYGILPFTPAGTPGLRVYRYPLTPLILPSLPPAFQVLCFAFPFTVVR